MSYYTRQCLLLTPAAKWDEEQHPRAPAGGPDGGQFTSGSGGEGGGGGSIRHNPISYGRNSYGIERVVETGGKGLRSQGRLDKEFPSMEAARAHAAELDRPPVKVDDALEDMQEEIKPGYFGRNLEGQRNLIGPPGDRMAKMRERGALPMIDPLARAPKPRGLREAIRDKYRAGQAKALWGKR